MTKKFGYFLAAAFLLLPFVPIAVKAAAGDVTVTDTVTSIVLPSDGRTYALSTMTNVESFTVNSGSIVFSMPTNSIFRLTSADKSTFTLSGASSCALASATCETGQSRVDVICNAATTQTVTVDVSSATCTGSPTTSSGGGSASSGGGGGGSAPVTPSAPAVPVTPSVPVAVAPPPAVVPAPALEPPALLQVTAPAITLFQPGAAIAYTYQYKNETAKTQKLKIQRQLVGSDGKVVKTATVSKTLKPGSVLVSTAKDAVSKTLPPGDYLVKVKVLDTANRVLDETSFDVVVEKLKKKTFVMGEVSSVSSDIVFDEASLTKVKTDVVLPVALKLKYSYTNSTDKKQTVRMVRELLDENGKVKGAGFGRWVMKAGEKDTVSINQPVASNLSVGGYTLRVRALDWQTKEVLAENSLNFTVELK